MFMNIEIINQLLPYLTQGLLIAGMFIIRSRIVLTCLLAGQILFAFVNGIIDPIGLFAIAAFWGVCALHWRNLASHDGVNTLRVLGLAAIAIGFASHMIPGFHNLRVFNGILISQASVPFTMYLNFDKTIAAIILVLTSGLIFRQTSLFGMKAWRETILAAVLCVSLLVPSAVLSGYVHFDPKFPDSLWFWAFNNLLFVSFSEEVIFRGIIQNQLTQLTNRWNMTPFISIFISALLFAVALPGHRQGGLHFMAFVTLAGMFYGYVYHRTKRLEAAMFVHFFVNLIHFLLFSYPMAATLGK
jgi:membrane protease YdiL (CAAX protease family)